MSGPTPKPERSWSSKNLSKEKALQEWYEWAEKFEEPLKLDVKNEEEFEADWHSFSIGQLRLLVVEAGALEITNVGADHNKGNDQSDVHLALMLEDRMEVDLDGNTIEVPERHWILLDHKDDYLIRTYGRHKVLDLSMPPGWLDRYVPQINNLVNRCIPGDEGWGAPLISLLDVLMAGGLYNTPTPHPIIAEQIGRLLGLAADIESEEGAPQHRQQIVNRILRLIENGYAFPDISADKVAKEIGISKRYLQSLLAESGTGFVQELNSVRLIQASEMLLDLNSADLPISDIAYRVGILDPAYFARIFKKRFGMTPRAWRSAHKS